MKWWTDASRKWKISLIAIGIVTILPFIYRFAGISDSITQIVLGAIIALPTSYNFANALAKKNGEK